MPRSSSPSSSRLPTLLPALLFAVLLGPLASLPVSACDAAKTDQALLANESKALLDNAPTFRHGWQDGKITLRFDHLRSEGDHCAAGMHLTLPQQDLDDVNAYLDRNPAKRILLGAQGYAIPEQRNIDLDYRYTAQGASVTAANDDNLPLKNLHHSIEFMYQLLAQIRAEVSADAHNDKPWPAAARTAAAESCAASLSADGKPVETACQCRVEGLQQHLDARQQELVDYLQNQPYATATGALNSYFALSSAINHRCGLSKR